MKNEFKYRLKSGDLITAKPPTMRKFREFDLLENDVELSHWVADCTGLSWDDVLEKFNAEELSDFVAEYRIWIIYTRCNSASMHLPYAPREKRKAFFEVNHVEEKIISDYANMSISETLELDVFTFWELLHDAVVYNADDEYLEDAYNYSRTEPDRERLRARFGGGDEDG